jgi:hypothetical protein
MYCGMVRGSWVVLYRECSLHSAVLLLVKREQQNSAALSSHPCSGRACHPGVKRLAIDGRLQLHGRWVAQGGHGEAGRFGHLNELGKALGELIAVERQFCSNRVAHRFRIASEDGAFAGVPRGDLDTDVVRLYMERSCNLHDLRGESESHRDSEVAQG